MGGLIANTLGRKALGEAVGIALNNTVQTFGSVYGDAAEEAHRTGNPIDLPVMLTGATVSTAIDTLADRIGLDALTAKTFKGNALERLGKSMGAQMAVQGGTEAVQRVPEEWGPAVIRMARARWLSTSTKLLQAHCSALRRAPGGEGAPGVSMLWRPFLKTMFPEVIFRPRRRISHRRTCLPPSVRVRQDRRSWVAMAAVGTVVPMKHKVVRQAGHVPTICPSRRRRPRQRAP